ncbi:MAG: sigma-54 dependent transcriptional regulator [Acidobacteria bacterium]|nr:sigma-54 dependent transcriptional regulator [Acidobacteriota bacterium]
MRNRVLLVEDQASVRFGIREFLETHDIEVDEAENCQAARERFLRMRPDAAVLDYALPDGTALDLLVPLREIDATVPLVVLTAHGSIDLAVRAVKAGADQFLTKPVELPALLIILQRLIDQARLKRHQQAGLALEQRARPEPFLGSSAVIRTLEAHARRVATADSPLLLLGETGTGKGVLASWLHRHSGRAGEPFVELNCASLSQEFVETELFGHEKGAFTGAGAAKLGLLEVAHRGTAFLDEIGDLHADVQPRLLKVLEEQRFRRLGSVTDRYVDVRLIAATHRDLGTLVREARFRADLYFRINTIPLRVPPLRERAEDIPLLACRLIEQTARAFGRQPLELSRGAEEALCRYPWPGNIRELRNVLERAVLLSDGPALGVRDLRFETGASEPVVDARSLTLREVEQRHIEAVLREERGRVDRAAVRLGIARSSLYQKIKQYRIAVVKV